MASPPTPRRSPSPSGSPAAPGRPPRRWCATPSAATTTARPIDKVTKNENLNSAAMGGNPADSAVNANVVSIVTGALTNYPQSTAYYGLAQGGGTTAGSDAVGLIGIGIIANVGSTSWG